MKQVQHINDVGKIFALKMLTISKKNIYDRNYFNVTQYSRQYNNEAKSIT